MEEEAAAAAGKTWPRFETSSWLEGWPIALLQAYMEASIAFLKVAVSVCSAAYELPFELGGGYPS